MSTAHSRGSWGLSRARSIRVHRWLGLILCAFWLIQAVTGLLSVFHWELEDRSISSAWEPTDLSAIEARLAAIAPPKSGKRISVIWTTAGLPDRYDVWVADERGGSTSVFRISGDGTVLRTQDAGSLNFFDYIIELHQSLLVGKYGRWIIGLSGIVLISHLLLGLRAAWPTPGRWAGALRPRRTRSRHARLHEWHRALGLLFGIPALLLFSAGAALAYKVGISSLTGANAPSMAAQAASADSTSIGFASAVDRAFRVTHARRLTEVEMPTEADSTYRIRVLGPGELRRAVGTTTVFIDARTGRVRGSFPPSSQLPSQRFINTLYSIHTGEIGGLAGRLFGLAIGTWLLTMILLGLCIWIARKRNISAKRSAMAVERPNPDVLPFVQSRGPAR